MRRDLSAQSDVAPRRTVGAGIFETVAAADAAVRALHEEGFAEHEIAVVSPEWMREHFAAEADVVEPAGAHTPEAVATGGTIGALLGGLTAIAGLVATGGAGLLVAGGMLGGAAAGGVAGGFIGAMTTRGLEPEIADYYDQALRRGKILVAVEPKGPDHSRRLRVAERIFEGLGARTIELPEG
jgi:hypothetical protein